MGVFNNATLLARLPFLILCLRALLSGILNVVSPSPHLYIFFVISISLHYTENDSLRFAYSWRHRQKIVLYLAETEIQQTKIKDKRTSIATI
jgi:hypothetical protein